MKTNAKQIEAIANLVKPFDAIQTAHFLAREIVGYNKSSDKLVELQKQIDDTKNEKGARKKAIDGLLKELWTNNVKMIEGKGVTKCPIRIALKEVLSKEGLAEKTIANICGAICHALKYKAPYDIKYLEKKVQQKKIDDAKKQGATAPTTTAPTTTAPTTTAPTTTAPTTTAPTTTAPTTTAPTTTAPTTTAPKVNAPKVEPESATQYVKAIATLMDSAFAISEPRRMLGDTHEKTYEDIISAINDIMDLVATLK